MAASALYRLDRFHPAVMIALGAHDVPFVFLYGMRMFALLAGILRIGGPGRDRSGPPVLHGAWVTGVVLSAFAVAGRSPVLREEGRARGPGDTRVSPEAEAS